MVSGSVFRACERGDGVGGRTGRAAEWSNKSAKGLRVGDDVGTFVVATAEDEAADVVARGEQFACAAALMVVQVGLVAMPNKMTGSHAVPKLRSPCCLYLRQLQ